MKSLIKLCALLLITLVTTHTHAIENRLSPLGINTNEAMDINASVPFIDLFRLASAFNESRPWLTKGKVVYDKNGWPSELVKDAQAGTRFLNNIQAESIPKGVYSVMYHGQGRIRYGGNIQLVRHYPGRDLIRFRPVKNRITGTLTITETNKKNYIRNIRIIMPGGICKNKPMKRVAAAKDCAGKPFQSFAGHYQRLVFNPDYLEFMKIFRVIRFMNMSGITRNNLTKWEDRPQLADATWGGKEGVRGIPLEIMISLANKLDADPWINLPHRADDNFVHQTASMVKRHLKPSLKSYIEYTNEAWNGIFSQAHYIQDRGVHLGLDANRTYAGFKYYSLRSVEMFKIWEKVFGNNSRLVRVMGGMTTNVPMTNMLLGYQDAFRHVDALAIAPYFHASQQAVKNVKSVDEVFQLLTSPRNRYSIPRTMNLVRNQAKIVARYGVDLVAYEGGQHLVAYGTHTNTEAGNEFLIAANKDQRMAKLYYDFLKGWKDAGGKLFVAFSAPREYNWIGSWGIKEHIAQHPNDAPKYRGLMYFQKKNRCWWNGCATTRPVARKSKPAYNPGSHEMARRFKPALPKVVSIKRAKRKPTKRGSVVARIFKKRKKK